jgi:YVTN family beta-propeller protein
LFAGLTLLALQAKANPLPIFVLNSLDADVSVIDPVHFTQARRVPTGKEPHHLYLTPDGQSVIVANAEGNSLTFLNPRTGEVQRTLRDIADPYHLRFSPDMKWLVIAANRLDHIDIYRWQDNTPVLAKRIAAPNTPSHIFIDSKSQIAYVSLQDSDELVAVDLPSLSLKWKISVGDMPADVYLSADDKRLFVALTGSDQVEAYDVSHGGARPATLLARIKTADGAHAFRAKGDKRHVFVSNRVANNISLLDTQDMKVLASYPAPGGPDCMELLADGKTLIVTSRWAKKLTFIDTEQKKVIRQVPVGRSPHGVWTLHHAPRQ